VVVTTGAVRRAVKSSPPSHHHTPSVKHFYRPDALPVTNQPCQSTDTGLCQSVECE